MRFPLSLCLVFTAAACGPRPEPETPVDNEPEDQPPAARVVTPCPGGDALTEAARAAWGKAGGNVFTDCVAVVVGGETLWYLDGTFEPEGHDDYMMGMWTALVTPAGEVRWVEGDDEVPYGAAMRSYASDHEAVDLDGDGNDEILYVSGYSHGGYEDSSLVVLRVTSSGVQSLGEGIPLDSDNTAADPDPADVRTCVAGRRLLDAGAGKRIEITYTGQCERTGAVTWELDATGLKEIR